MAGIARPRIPEELRRQVAILDSLPGFPFLEHDCRRVIDRPNRCNRRESGATNKYARNLVDAIRGHFVDGVKYMEPGDVKPPEGASLPARNHQSGNNTQIAKPEDDK